MIVLARATRGDGPALIAANLASRAHHAPWVSPFVDAAGFDAWFGETLAGGRIGLVVRESAGGAIAGMVNLNGIQLGVYRGASLGWYAMAGMGGRGLMRVALRSAVGLAFGEFGLHRLEANIQPGNARSLALAGGLGFRLEGFSPRYLFIDGAWRDHERWAITAEEWPALAATSHAGA